MTSEPLVVGVVGLGYGRRCPAARGTHDLGHVLADDEVDAVFLATPVFTHYELAAACLRAGKHTFVEKPLAPSAELADDLITLACERDRVLMCGHTFVYSPPVRALKRMLDERVLGTVYFISSSRVNLRLRYDSRPRDDPVTRQPSQDDT
jgi:predicted dehydrogenase